MLEIPEFLKKTAENCGFLRESYDESKSPTTIHNVSVLPLFSDIRGSVVASSLVLRRYREIVKASKYFILCSWPGHKILYPWVDEYWSVKDIGIVKQLFNEAVRFRNNSEVSVNFFKDLNQSFYEVLDPKELEKYYGTAGGLQDEFVGRFQNIKRFLPMIPSKGMLGLEFNRLLVNRAGHKVMIYPTTHYKAWRHKVENSKVPIDFWISLAKRLKTEGFTPVVLQNYGTYDLSKDLGEDAIYFNEYDLAKVMSAMRAVDCVLDVFNDLSRFAGIARAPYVCCSDRVRYMAEKDYELDDLVFEKLPKQYIFAFTTILERGSEAVWNVNLFDNIVVRLRSFLMDLNSDLIPTASELNEEISYKDVRVKKIKKMGVKFIKVQQD